MEKLFLDCNYVDFCDNKQGILNAIVKNFDQEKAFYIADIDQVKYKINQWKTLMPDVKMYYAVKCNPDVKVIQCLIKSGCGFDCASPFEIKTCLELGADPKDIIYANPCKTKSDIKYAKDNKIDITTFDSLEELTKIKNIHPQTDLVMRIHVDDSKSMWRLSEKYGTKEAHFETMMKKCVELDLNLMGLSFHVGSACYDVSTFAKAIKLSYKCTLIAKQYNFKISLIDIGGGFPGQNDLLFEKLALTINKELKSRFPEKVRFIAEPGRYVVSSAFTLSVNVISKRITYSEKTKENIYMYYINDGIFGSFGFLCYDRSIFKPKILSLKNTNKLQVCKKSIVWGPTCAAFDCLSEDEKLPELEVGDWLYFENMGAYTISLMSDFNGIEKLKVYYINE